MNLLKPLLATAGFWLALYATTVLADQVQLYDQPPSAEEMGRVLFDQNAETSPDVKMRSISFGIKAPPTPKNKANTKSTPRKNKKKSTPALAMVSIGLPIKFAYNSDEISETSLPFLEQVGKMLTLPKYATKRLVIEGHTDAIGSASYNKILSQRRASAVKHYLSEHFGIVEARLRAYGLGESKPLPGYSPDDEANRRVQFYSAK